MVSCDDDFSLLGDEAQSHHPHLQQLQQLQRQASVSVASAAAAGVASFSTERYISKATLPIHSRSLPFNNIREKKVPVGSEGENEDHESYGEAFADDDPVSNHFDPLQSREDSGFNGDDNSERKSCAAAAAATTTASVSHFHYQQQQLLHASHNETKRRDRDELSDEESPYGYNMGNKRSRTSSVAPSSSGDYRKDREEWSDSAIGCLLDAFTEKYIHLNRGNMRGRDWEDVATTVSQRCKKLKSGKTVEQCKNKVDNLKKRYKAECQRLSSGIIAVSHWLWFKKMEQIVASSPSSSKTAVDDDKAAAIGDSTPVSKQMKRYPGTSPSSAGLTTKLKSLPNPRWKRAVLKISGAALAGTGPQNVDPKVMMLIAREVAIASRAGVEVAIVVGRRNFFCGDAWLSATDTDKTTAYQIGMMASTMNAILLQASFEKIGVESRVQTTFMMQEIADLYIRRRAIRHLEKGRIIIFGGIGVVTGNPLFTTDTAAALRATEINADAVLKGTTSDGLYDCHSRNGSSAFEHISFRDLVARGFASMDMTAVSFCEESNIPGLIPSVILSANFFGVFTYIPLKTYYITYLTPQLVYLQTKHPKPTKIPSYLLQPFCIADGRRETRGPPSLAGRKEGNRKRRSSGPSQATATGRGELLVCKFFSPKASNCSCVMPSAGEIWLAVAGGTLVVVGWLIRRERRWSGRSSRERPGEFA